MSNDRDPNYKNPGSAKVRVTLFWCTNHTPDISKKQLDYAEKLLAEHNIGFDVLPGKARTDKHTITVPDRPLLPEEYEGLRHKVAAIFDDQKTTDKRQRLPVIFTQVKDWGNAITVITKKPEEATGSTWLPYCLIGSSSDSDLSPVIHEIGHAAHNSRVHSPDKGHIMHEAAAVTPRTIIDRLWVGIIARAYFCK